MYNKTTGPYFAKYGTIIKNKDYQHDNSLDVDIFETSIRSIDSTYYYDSEIIIECVEGISMLCLTDNNNKEKILEFVCHRTFSLNKGINFNIIPMTPSSKFKVYFTKNSYVTVNKLAKHFQLTHIKSTLTINEIYSFYYNVKGSDYKFEGESHNFYELVYVDNGKLMNFVNNEKFELEEYELMIFGVDQFHRQEVINDKVCSYLTVNFDLDMEDPSVLLNRKFKINREILDLINNYVKESSLKIPFREDLMICHLKQIIILLLQENARKDNVKPVSPITQYFEDELINEIIIYINQNVYSPITIDDVCTKFSVSRSSLQNMFKDNLKVAPKQYINEIKLSKSKILIKENKNNISAIALMLGFSSIHYFSRKFTQRYGITPSDYAKSIYTN